MPSFLKSRHAPFLLFSLTSNDIYLSLRINRSMNLCWRPLSSKRERQLLNHENDSIKQRNLSTHPNLLFGCGCWCWWGRRWCSCGRRWCWRLSGFRLLFDCWLLWGFSFASNPNGSKIDYQNQCEQEQDPLLHVSSPPF
jgi:hypothetical protein